MGIRRNIDEDMTTGIANSKTLTKPSARFFLTRGFAQKSKTFGDIEFFDFSCDGEADPGEKIERVVPHPPRTNVINVTLLIS